jgi:hypothetical protein
MNTTIKLVGKKKTRKLKSLHSLTVNSQDLDSIPDSIGRMPGLGIPDRLMVSLVYDQDQLSLVNASTSASYLFSGNSCFDPDTSGIGHQPLYFDQFAQLYNRYRVHASQIVFELLNSTISSHVTITPTTDGTWPSSLRNALETNYTCSIPISSSVFRTVKDRSISTRKIWGMQSITQDDLYQAVYSASPVRQWYWKLWGESADGVTNVSIRCNVRIVYEVEFFDRYPIGPSKTPSFGVVMKSSSFGNDGIHHITSVVTKDEKDGKQCQCGH